MEFKYIKTQEKDSSHHCNGLLITDGHRTFIRKAGDNYPADRRTTEVYRSVIYETVEADSFNHAIDLIELNDQIEQLKNHLKGTRIIIRSFKDAILRKLGKKLRGKKDQTKINNFLK